MERATARKAQATQVTQADISSPATLITKAVISKRMTDEEYQAVILSKMKTHIQNKLTASSNNLTKSKGNQ
jgi:hypothetical protein